MAVLYVACKLRHDSFISFILSPECSLLSRDFCLYQEDLSSCTDSPYCSAAGSSYQPAASSLPSPNPIRTFRVIRCSRDHQGFVGILDPVDPVCSAAPWIWFHIPEGFRRTTTHYFNEISCLGGDPFLPIVGERTEPS